MAEITFIGEAGKLEGRYHHNRDSSSPVVLVLHPHPKHGGTMNNKIVYNLYSAFVKQGFSVLRFNFRGVGRSAGNFDGGVGELTDAATALDLLREYNPEAKSFWISGFSFGAWIAFHLLMRRPEIMGFVNVSPPTNLYDFSFLSPCPRPGLIVQGDQDGIVREKYVSSFYEKLSIQQDVDVEYHVVKGADHFFRYNLPDFNKLVLQYLENNKEMILNQSKSKMKRKRPRNSKSFQKKLEEKDI